MAYARIGPDVLAAALSWCGDLPLDAVTYTAVGRRLRRPDYPRIAGALNGDPLCRVDAFGPQGPRKGLPSLRHNLVRGATPLRRWRSKGTSPLRRFGQLLTWSNPM